VSNVQSPPRVTPDISRVADEFLRLARTFGRMRQQFVAASEQEVEWSAHLVLRCLAGRGPQRSGAVADALDADPSTVSRQVAALVREGLVERRADPVDGRASVLALTDKGAEVLSAHDRQRHEHFARLLADWDTPDRAHLADLLARFTTDLDDYRDHYRDQWTPTRDHLSASSAEGTH
jgi:DNA-binding MarR family transcriptional regulator